MFCQHMSCICTAMILSPNYIFFPSTHKSSFLPFFSFSIYQFHQIENFRALRFKFVQLVHEISRHINIFF